MHTIDSWVCGCVFFDALGLDENVFEPFPCVLMKAVAVAISGGPQPQACGGRGFLSICRIPHKGVPQLPSHGHDHPTSVMAGRTLRGHHPGDRIKSLSPFCRQPEVLVAES